MPLRDINVPRYGVWEESEYNEFWAKRKKRKKVGTSSSGIGTRVTRNHGSSFLDNKIVLNCASRSFHYSSISLRRARYMQGTRRFRWILEYQYRPFYSPFSHLVILIPKFPLQKYFSAQYALKYSGGRLRPKDGALVSIENCMGRAEIVFQPPATPPSTLGNLWREKGYCGLLHLSALWATCRPPAAVAASPRYWRTSVGR